MGISVGYENGSSNLNNIPVGYYYYAMILGPDMTTTDLMDEIIFNSADVANYKGEEIDVKISVINSIRVTFK